MRREWTVRRMEFWKLPRRWDHSQRRWVFTLGKQPGIWDQLRKMNQTSFSWPMTLMDSLKLRTWRIDLMPCALTSSKNQPWFDVSHRGCRSFSRNWARRACQWHLRSESNHVNWEALITRCVFIRDTVMEASRLSPLMSIGLSVPVIQLIVLFRRQDTLLLKAPA